MLGFLYVDGHVRTYHGKRAIAMGYDTRTRLAVPATTDYWIKDRTGDPLFVVTADANSQMTKMLVPVLEQVREWIGPDRRITIVFDRGGWSPKLFYKLLVMNFDILTCRKGPDHIAGLAARRKSLPARIPLSDTQSGQKAVKLSTERKHLTNILKMVAYQIERNLVGQVRSLYARAEDEGRTFIQAALQSTAAIEPTKTELHVKIGPLSSPHRSKALAALCETLNKTNTQFPGTRLTMRFSAEQHRDS